MLVAPAEQWPADQQAALVANRCSRICSAAACTHPCSAQVLCVTLAGPIPPPCPVLTGSASPAASAGLSEHQAGRSPDSRAFRVQGLLPSHDHAPKDGAVRVILEAQATPPASGRCGSSSKCSGRDGIDGQAPLDKPPWDPHAAPGYGHPRGTGAGAERFASGRPFQPVFQTQRGKAST